MPVEVEEQILQSQRRGIWAGSQQRSWGPRNSELTGQREHNCMWKGTSDNVVGTRAAGRRLVSCIESSEREGLTYTVTLAKCSLSRSLYHLPNRSARVTLQGGQDDSR